MLRAFMERPERVLNRPFLLSHVWGYDLEIKLSKQTVDMVVVGLRKKLGKAGKFLETVKGYGYRLNPAEGG